MKILTKWETNYIAQPNNYVFQGPQLKYTTVIKA